MTAVRTTCPYCGVGCGIVAARPKAGGSTVVITGDANHPANAGRLCSKGAALAETLGPEGRLLYPEIHGRRVTWDDALDVVASRFAATIAEHGRDSVAFYVSGQLLTEDYYVANKLMKGFIGSANIDTNSRLCMASAVAGHKRAFGEDVVPGAYADLDAAELFVIVGSNMAWCHPILFQRVRRAKEERPHVRVVVIDPRRTATADVADVFLPIRPGTDAVLFNGLLSYMRREDALDWEYIDAHVDGASAALRAAKASSPSVPSVAAACGVPEHDVAEFYRLFVRTPQVVTLFSQGVNQSSSGTDKVNAILNVHLASGRIGREGAGPFSITGQPNAMGGREVGALANQLAAHMDFSPDHVERVARFWRAPHIATRPGLRAVELFDAVHAGKIKAIWIMATNPVVSMPDADRVADALERCPFVVVSDCFRHADTARYADVLLPAAAWGEKSGTVTNSERRISRQRPFLEPAGESRPDWRIVCDVARGIGFGRAFTYRSPAEIFREHARLSAFENDGSRAFDIGALAELSDEEYDALEPVQWPLPAARADAAQDVARPKRLFGDGRFFTPNGKARLVAVEPRAPRSLPNDAAPIVLNTGRTRDQWHTMTRTGRSPRLTGHRAEPFVDVHPDDAVRFALDDAGLAVLENARGRMLARVRVTTDVRRGEVFAPMHWSAQFATLGRVNTLVAPEVDPVSGQPELKHAVVRLRRHSPARHGFVLSREPLVLPGCEYAVRARLRGCWRIEFADDADARSWPEWARAVLGADGEWIELSDPGRRRYRAAVLERRRLKACLFASSDPIGVGREWLAAQFDEAEIADAVRPSLLAGGPAQRDGAAAGIVCACFSVARSVLVDVIRAQSLTTAAEIGRILGAGTSCGSCVPELNALIAAERRA